MTSPLFAHSSIRPQTVDPFLEEIDQAAEALQIKLPNTDKRTMRYSYCYY